MEQTRIKDIKRGDFFTLRDYGDDTTPAARVYVRGDYDRAARRYWIYKFDDVNSGRMMDGGRVVYVGFTF